jgi:hypothetical protein
MRAGRFGHNGEKDKVHSEGRHNFGNLSTERRLILKGNV